MSAIHQATSLQCWQQQQPGAVTRALPLATTRLLRRAIAALRERTAVHAVHRDEARRRRTHSGYLRSQAAFEGGVLAFDARHDDVFARAER